MALPELIRLPNSTVYNNRWSVVNAASLHAAIAELTAAADETDYVETTQNLKDFRVGYENVPQGLIKVVDRIIVRAWVYVALNGASSLEPTFGFFINGTPVIPDYFHPEFMYGGKQLITATKVGLSLSEADCNTIETRTLSYGHGWVERSTLLRVYAQQLDLRYESASVVERHIGEIEINNDPVVMVDNDRPVSKMVSVVDPIVDISDNTVRKILSYQTPVYEGEIIE
jgi:hypothetical protein